MDEFAEDVIRSPKVKPLLGKVICVKDPELERPYPAKWAGWAEIETIDGQRRKSRVEMPKGEPENPLAWEELVEKFHTLTAPVFSAARRKAIIEATAQLETVQDIRDLASLLQAETPASRQGPGRA